MSGAFVIEIEDQTAGLVLSEKGGFVFRASNPVFRKLEGRVFQHVRQARAAAAALWRDHCARPAAPVEAAAVPVPIQISWGSARPAPSAHAVEAGHRYVRRAAAT